VGNDLNLALALLLDNDVVAQVVGAALDLDGVLEELLKGGDVEDLVASRLRSVDDELSAPLAITPIHNRACLSLERKKNLPSWSSSGPCPTSSTTEMTT
jgi:hypothetical protein